MKKDKNILIAFLLNLGFSIFEFFGGLFTNSVAILSDSIHDMGDAVSIGLSYILERKSKNEPDNKYTYGYVRYSVLGGLITTMILFAGSILVIYNSIDRIISPVKVNYQGMIILAIIGVVINIVASYVTSDKSSFNQKSVNLHMLEDVLGWIVVLIGSIIMNFTDIRLIDPIMSIGVSLFILINTIKNLKEILDLFLEKTPSSVNIDKLKKHLLEIKDVDHIHHIHVWSIDGFNNYATMHIVTNSKNLKKLKNEIREELKEFGIIHSILETEDEVCDEETCVIKNESQQHDHHHHH